jgi:hypothetical protein
MSETPAQEPPKVDDVETAIGELSNLTAAAGIMLKSDRIHPEEKQQLRDIRDRLDREVRRTRARAPETANV